MMNASKTDLFFSKKKRTTAMMARMININGSVTFSAEKI